MLIAERDAAMKERDKLEAESSEVKKVQEEEGILSGIALQLDEWTQGTLVEVLRSCAMAKGLLEGLEICSFYDPIAVLGLQESDLFSLWSVSGDVTFVGRGLP